MKEHKLVWTDDGQTKTARGNGSPPFDIVGDGVNVFIIFHGYEGDIVVTPKSLVSIT